MTTPVTPATAATPRTVFQPHRPFQPDFQALYHSCPRCDGVRCPHGGRSSLTPRTSRVFFDGLSHLRCEARFDVDDYGDDPLPEYGGHVLWRYPAFTRSYDGLWRRKAARAFADLQHDMQQGVLPKARCPAEEMAVILALDYCSTMMRDLPEEFDFTGLPRRVPDFDWWEVQKELLDDPCEDSLLARWFDGNYPEFRQLRLPATARNERYRADRWFDFRPGTAPRDPDRGFR
jgi:hypothetical protein